MLSSTNARSFRETLASNTMLVQEENVLELRKVSLQNPDHWPTFNLERITVLSQKTGKKTSLLSAHRGNPVRVTGTLEEIDNDLLHLGTIAQSLIRLDSP